MQEQITVKHAACISNMQYVSREQHGRSANIAQVCGLLGQCRVAVKVIAQVFGLLGQCRVAVKVM